MVDKQKHPRKKAVSINRPGIQWWFNVSIHNALHLIPSFNKRREGLANPKKAVETPWSEAGKG